MRADNSQFIVAAAKRRREDALARADAVIATALRTGEQITVSELATRANVSRSWLYAEQTLREAVVQVASTGRVPRRRRHELIRTPDPASDASLRTRLDVALARARRLETENKQLRDQLASALGQLRVARVTGAGGASSRG